MTFSPASSAPLSSAATDSGVPPRYPTSAPPNPRTLTANPVLPSFLFSIRLLYMELRRAAKVPIGWGLRRAYTMETKTAVRTDRLAEDTAVLQRDGIVGHKGAFSREWVEEVREDMMTAFW